MANSARIDELQRKFAENPRRYFAPLANEYRKSGNLEQAILICQEYLPQQPGHMSGHIVYGQTLYEAGRFAEARAVFETALALDPENLIALHHLGDIARQLGDIDGARGWYRRVLETDPRSEEIIQMLAELDGAPSSAPERTDGSDVEAPAAPVPSPVSFDVTPDLPPIPVAPASAAEEVSTLDFVPPASSDNESPDANAGAFELVAMEAPEAEAPVDDIEEPVPVNMHHVEDDVPIEVEVQQRHDAGVPAADVRAADVHAADVHTADVHEPAYDEAVRDETVRDEADRHGADRDEPARDEAPAMRTEEPDDAERAPEEEVLMSVDLASSVTRSEDASLLDADLFGEPSVESTEPAESGVELSVDDMSQSSEDIEREGDIFEAPAYVPAMNALVGDIPEARSPFTPPTSDAAIAADAPPEPAAELRADAALETAPIDGGHDGQEVPAEPGEVFVTETMAELYLRQGHLEAALDIFRRLVAQRPSESALRDRLRAVEDLLFGNTVEIATPATPAASRPAAGATATPVRSAPVGPTIRDFLSGILTRRGRVAASAPRSENGGTTTGTDAHPPATAVAESPEKSHLEAMFADAGAPSESNVAAASMLAEAFAADEPGASPLKGLPAHRAAKELSLDQVFRSNTPAAGTDAGGAFSFDRFFAEGSVEQTPPPSAEPASSSAGSADDIEQFNAWLSGLKKA